MALLSIWVLMSCDSSKNKTVFNFDDTINNTELQKIWHQQQNTETLYFSFNLRDSLHEDTHKYLPFLKYLEKAINSSETEK